MLLPRATLSVPLKVLRMAAHSFAMIARSSAAVFARRTFLIKSRSFIDIFGCSFSFLFVFLEFQPLVPSVL